MNTEIFFILGRGRSGTTLLSRILNAHENVSIAAETLVIKNLHKKYRNQDWSDNTIQEFIDDLFLEKRVEYWKISRKELFDFLVSNGPYSSFQEIVKQLYIAYKWKNFGGSDVTIVGEKNLHYSINVPLLESIFPNGKYIFMVRNYKDNVASFKGVSFDLNNTAALCYRWNYYNRQVLKHMKREPGKYMLLRYEDIANKPQDSIKNLCSFLNIPYDASMLDFYKKEDKEDREWHRNIKSPLNPSHIGKWRKVLSEQDARICDLICGKMSEILGYGPVQKNYGFIDRVKSMPGLSLGWFMTILEVSLSFLPFTLRIWIINLYRSLVGVK